MNTLCDSIFLTYFYNFFLYAKFVNNKILRSAYFFWHNILKYMEKIAIAFLKMEFSI